MVLDQLVLHNNNYYLDSMKEVIHVQCMIIMMNAVRRPRTSRHKFNYTVPASIDHFRLIITMGHTYIHTYLLTPHIFAYISTFDIGFCYHWP